MIDKNLKYFVAKQDISTKPGLRQLFFAEGDSEAFLLEKILDGIAADANSTGVVCFNGISWNFKAKIGLPKKFPNFANVVACAFFLDADDNAAAKIDLIRDAAVSIGFPAPNGEGQTEQNGLRTGLFISPGNGAVGRIEDMVLREVAATELWPCLEAYSQCSSNAGQQLDSKSIVQSYISARSPGLCGVGRAFDARVLKASDPAYDSVREFVRSTLAH